VKNSGYFSEKLEEKAVDLQTIVMTIPEGR
jgi:hypothetical protein